MIYFSLAIQNPFSNRFNIIKSYNGSAILKHKHWEFNIYKTSDIIGIDFDITHQCDHAGFSIQLSLFGYSAEYQFYDSRHWDRERKSWSVVD